MDSHDTDMKECAAYKQVPPKQEEYEAVSISQIEETYESV